MKTAVFADVSGEQKPILGFLEHEDLFASYRTFSVKCAPKKGPWPSLSDPPAKGPVIELAHFEWATIGALRDDSGAYYARVLITKNMEELSRVRGFKWFAEECGKFYPAARASKTA